MLELAPRPRASPSIGHRGRGRSGGRTLKVGRHVHKGSQTLCSVSASGTHEDSARGDVFWTVAPVLAGRPWLVTGERGPNGATGNRQAETVSGRRLTSVTPSLGLPWNSSCALRHGIDATPSPHLKQPLSPGAPSPRRSLLPSSFAGAPPLPPASTSVHRETPLCAAGLGLHSPSSSRERCLPPGLREGPLERPRGCPLYMPMPGAASSWGPFWSPRGGPICSNHCVLGSQGQS